MGEDEEYSVANALTIVRLCPIPRASQPQLPHICDWTILTPLLRESTIVLVLLRQERTSVGPISPLLAPKLPLPCVFLGVSSGAGALTTTPAM